MAKSRYSIYMGNIRTKIRTYQEQGKDVLYTAIFITGKEKVRLVDRALVAQLSLVSKNLKCENPDKVRIELYDGKESPNPLWLSELILNEPKVEPVESGFKGFGEADINRIVDERFRERQRVSEYEELKERVLELTEENEELQDSLEQLEAENQKLNQEIEGKKQIRYYAGMLGDILESFGIAKDKVKRPLAELMGIPETDRDKKELSEHAGDTSGIVEAKNNPSTEESKRDEIISLISDYLRSTSNQTLASVFSIFSEIEANTTMAESILQFINQQKNVTDAKV
ncbi:MAG: hypothetical protein U0T82_11870 [Bacteroidales bacterium]